MAKRNGLRIFVLSLVGAATLVCLVFTGLLVRLAIRTLNTTDEEVIARSDKQSEIDQRFEHAFGGNEAGSDFGEIEINLGSLPTPGGMSAPGGIPAPPVIAESNPVQVEESAPAETTPVVASAAQTITLDVDAQGKVSYEGQPLTQDSLTAFLQALDTESKIMLDVHPSCDEEMTQLWQYIIYQNGFTATTQRVADLPR